MPVASPVYIVTYDGDQLPGYVQSDDRPIALRTARDNYFGRDTFTSAYSGAAPRDISLTFWLTSTAGSNVSGLVELENVMDQYRAALVILTREPGLKQLIINDTDRYYEAQVDDVSMPLSAGKSRSMTYSVGFLAQPWAYAVTPASTTFTGNGSPSIAIGDSRRTYPSFSIPSGVTGFVATDENGKVLSFTRGSTTGTVTVDCSDFTVVNGSGVNAVSTMNSLNYGLHYKGTDGTYGFTVTGFAGSGTVTVTMRARYEL